MAHDCIFWGKFKNDKNGAICLPLAAHCLDVALCFRALCDLPAIRRPLNELVWHTTGRKLAETDFDRLAVICLLHDLGKANLGFQYKVFDPEAPRAGHIRELESLFDPYDSHLYKQVMVALDMDQLAGWFSDDVNACSYFMAAFSHHGRPVEFKGEQTGWKRLAKKWWTEGDLDPIKAISELMKTARRAFPHAFEPFGKCLPEAAPFHHRFAGYLVFCGLGGISLPSGRRLPQWQKVKNIRS